MITNKEKEIAQKAMDTALNNSCQAARVSILTSINNSFEYRSQSLDQLHQSSENKLYIELYIDGKYGSFSTNRIHSDSLSDFILNGIKSTQYLAKDLCQQLPDANRYYKGDLDLELSDKSYANISTEQKLDLIKQSVEEVREADKRIVSVSSSYGDSIDSEYMIASNGLEIESEDTNFAYSTEVSLKTDGHARAESYWYDTALNWSELQKEGIGRIALERTLRKLGQQKIKSGKYPMLIDNIAASRLLHPLIGAMSGSALQQKNSFLLNKLDQIITNEKLTIIDTPHIKRAFGARVCDGEGVATTQRTIIENGVLKTYFIDTYNALKMGVEPTIASPSIFTFECGERSFEAMLKSLDKAIWVTGFNGGNSNPTTGDFSLGIEGFLIENGETSTPISEMNITGNLLDLWSNLVELGNDPQLKTRCRIPSLLFSNVNFSGL